MKSNTINQYKRKLKYIMQTKQGPTRNRNLHE